MKNRIGWICPRCDAVNAPGIKQCGCTAAKDSLAARVGMKPAIPMPPRVKIPVDFDPPGAPPRIIYVHPPGPSGTRIA